MAFWSWSHTASSNATADSTINWAEGQAPSSVNDSARAMMARTAEFRDDISGAIVTGGTSTAYTVTSNQGFDTLAHMGNQIIAFTPHTTNAATVQLNVDGLGLKPLRSAPSTELNAGTIIQGTPYIAIYNNSDGAFYLQGFYGNAYNIPLAGGLPFFGSTAPNSSFVFPFGQAISRTTYAGLFSLVSTTYGTGDGSTTFNIPDLRGRVVAGKDDMGGSAASRLTSTYFGTSAAALGAVGGVEHRTLGSLHIPTLAGITGSNSISVTSPDFLLGNSVGNTGSSVGGGAQLTAADSGSGAVLRKQVSTGSNTITVSYTNNSQSDVPTVQPTLVGNFIMRVI